LRTVVEENRKNDTSKYGVALLLHKAIHYPNGSVTKLLQRLASELALQSHIPPSKP